MSRREDIDTGLWADSSFRALSRDGKLLLLWARTNARAATSMAGAYAIDAWLIAAETQIAPDDVDRALADLERARFIIYADGWLWVRARVHDLRTQTSSMAKGITSDLLKLPRGHRLLREFMREYGDARYWGRDGELVTALADAQIERLCLTHGEGTAQGSEATPLSLFSQDQPNRGTLHGGSQATATAGRGSSLGDLEGAKSSDARAPAARLVDDVVAILEQCPRLYVNRVGVENAIAAWPGQDARKAAHTVVAWASDPAFRSTNAAKLLADALSHQQRGSSHRPPARRRERTPDLTGAPLDDSLLERSRRERERAMAEMGVTRDELAGKGL